MNRRWWPLLLALWPATECGPPAQASDTPLATLYAVGEAAFEASEYDSATDVLGEVIALGQASADTSVEARALTLVGLIAYREGAFDSAQALQERALALKQAISLDAELYKSYNALGLIAWKRGRRMEAEDWFRKVLEAVPHDGDQTVIAIVAINRGLLQIDLGKFREAQASFEVAVDLLRTLGDRRRLGIAFNDLGMLANWRGDPLRAIAMLDSAVPHYQAAGFSFGLSNALGQYGHAYLMLGEVGHAVAALDSAVRLARAEGMRGEEAGNLELLAEVFVTTGDYQRALDLFTQAEGLNAELGLVSETGTDQRSSADVYQLLGEFDLADEFGRKALETHRSIDARWEVLGDLIVLLNVADQRSEPDAAARYLAEAKQLVTAMDARSARMDLALTEARIAIRSGSWGRALKALQRVAADVEAADYESLWEWETLRAQAFDGLGQLDSAEAAGRAGVAAVERVRSRLESDVLRSAYSTSRLVAYETLVDVLLQTGAPRTAFEVADAARGQALLEQLTGTVSSGGAALAGFDDAQRVLRRIAKLAATIREEEAWLPAERDSALLVEARRRLADARAEFEALRIRALERDTAGAALLGGTATDLERVQAALHQDEALIEYLVGDHRLILFVARRDTVFAVARQYDRDALAAQVRLVRGVLGDSAGDARSARDLLVALHTDLIAPAVEALAGVRRLILVPHDVLNYLPFAALLSGGSGRYLVEDYGLLFLPSAATLPVLRRAARRTGDNVPPRLIAFAPFNRTLPGTEEEVRSLSRGLPDAEVLTGNRADERRFRRALAQPSIVHLASHGVMNARSPLFSRVLLAGSGERPANDGRLEVHEVLDLKINTPLVFLSGCETGIGPAWSTGFARGEDYATLARAFLYAGARNVVSTLWRIADDGAAVFAKRFYLALEQADPVEALAQAQRTMLLHPRYSSPYYWAGYRLAGDGSLN